MGVKGSWKRPAAISELEAEQRWAATFGIPERRTRPATDLGSHLIRGIHAAAAAQASEIAPPAITE